MILKLERTGETKCLRTLAKLLFRRSGWLQCAAEMKGFQQLCFVVGWLAFVAAGLPARAEPIGSVLYSSGKATWIEGDLQRIAYAPGSTQSLSFKGKWNAVLSEKGTEIETSVGAVKRVTSFIGNDQIELETRSNNFQAGSIHSVKGSSGLAGADLIYAQYLLQRIQDVKFPPGQTATPTYAASWFHIASALQADVEHGIHCERTVQNGLVKDKWYVTHYIKKRSDTDQSEGKIYWPAYATNGFLAVEVSMPSGKFTPGEAMSIKEYWPKINPQSDDDVNLFRQTEINLVAEKELPDVNLLPKVTYDDARVEDYRFTNTVKNRPLNLPLKSAGWVLDGSPIWKNFAMEVGQLQAGGGGYVGEQIKSDRHVMARVIALILMLFSSTALSVAFLRGGMQNNKNK